jgi:hypothetical protein
MVSPYDVMFDIDTTRCITCVCESDRLLAVFYNHTTRQSTLCAMMTLTTKAHHLLNRAQQEAEYELEAIELTTAGVRVCEGLEGGFMSIHHHALMLSTIVRLIEIVKSSFQ